MGVYQTHLYHINNLFDLSLPQVTFDLPLKTIGIIYNQHDEYEIPHSYHSLDTVFTSNFQGFDLLTICDVK